MPGMTVRLAMWSGPRNISTAMMRAWENRADCVVVDEPFYACYLSAAAGIRHPMHDEVVASQPTSWREVAEHLTDSPCEADVFYQKQMTHHMLPGVDLDWTRKLTHCFLIRDPFEVVNSYRQKRESVTTDDIGIVRQWKLYAEIRRLTDQNIPVIDARQVLEDPRTVLERLCTVLGIPFTDTMLQWPAGRRSSDGVWAPHWYQAVERSTGFAPYQPRDLDLSPEDIAVAEASLASYEKLKAQLLV